MPNAAAHSLDLSALHPRQAAPPQPAPAGEQPQPNGSVPVENSDLAAEVQRLRTALQDVVALAHANADARQRVVQMQRRAIAALSGLDPRR